MSVTLPTNVTLVPAQQIGVSLRQSPPAAVTVVQGGPRGAQGPQGPSGGAASAQTFNFSNEDVWMCPHGLGRLPVTILVYDDVGMVRPFAEIANPDVNTTVVTFVLPLSGNVILT